MPTSVLLAVLFGLALAARVVVFALGSDLPNNDELAYSQLATAVAAGEGLARGGEPETHIAPLFPLLHAALIVLGSEPHWAGRVLGLITSAVAAPLAAWAWAPVLRRRWSLAAGLLIALHPRLLVTAERIQPEALSAALLLILAGCWLRDWPWGTAVAAALAYLSRPEAFVLLPAVVAVVGLLGERGARRRWLAPVGLAVLLALPYLIHLRVATGGWTVSGKTGWTYALAVAQDRHGNEPISSGGVRALEEEVGSASQHFVDRPGEAVGGYGRRLGRAVIYLGAAVWWPLLALALVGAGMLRRRSLGALLLPLSLLLLLPLAAVHARHVLPYVPSILVATMVGSAVALRRWLPSHLRMDP